MTNLSMVDKAKLVLIGFKGLDISNVKCLMDGGTVEDTSDPNTLREFQIQDISDDVVYLREDWSGTQPGSMWTGYTHEISLR